MPARMVHHFSNAVQHRASASWGRVRAALRSSQAARFPIPLALPCEIMLAIFEMLPPESAVSVVCCCQYMQALYCEEGTFFADQFWDGLLRRTFPARLTGAPGPNAPPRLRRSNKLTLCNLSCDWVKYVRELRAVRDAPTDDTHTQPLSPDIHPHTHPPSLSVHISLLLSLSA